MYFSGSRRISNLSNLPSFDSAVLHWRMCANSESANYELPTTSGIFHCSLKYDYFRLLMKCSIMIIKSLQGIYFGPIPPNQLVLRLTNFDFLWVFDLHLISLFLINSRFVFISRDSEPSNQSENCAFELREGERERGRGLEGTEIGSFTTIRLRTAEDYWEGV